MKTSRLQVASVVDDGECLSFHSIPLSPAPVSFCHPGFQLLLLPDGGHRLILGAETFALAGPKLVLMGPRLSCGYTLAYQPETGEGPAASESIALSTVASGLTASAFSVRWPVDLLGAGFLDKTQMKAIGALLEQADRGIGFPAAAIAPVQQRLAGIRKATGFTVVLGLLALLHELSAAGGQPMLGVPPPAPAKEAEKKSPIEEAMAFMEANYFLPMTLDEMARKACMTKGSFCRSFRKRTGKTYGESLNDIRIGHICRLLVETNDTVSEIAYRAGYQNIFHFHRHFKRQKGCTPKEYREGRSAGGGISGELE